MNEELKNIKALYKTISSSSNKVFIIGHNNPDLDSLASAIGLQELCTVLGKDAYIILDEPVETIELAVKRVRDLNVESHNIIDMKKYHQLKDSSSTLIVTDTNKQELVAVGNDLANFQKIIIIDHHAPGPTTIQNAFFYIPLSTDEKDKYKAKVSSASEIVAQLLFYSKVACPKDIYTYLYGGIYMDTNRFDKNVGEKTHETTQKLCSKGADTFAIKELLLSDFEEDRIIYNLIFNETLLKAYEYNMFNNYTIAFTLNREKPGTIYRKETLAKTADRLLNYKVDASFAMGYIDERTLYVSARSKGQIDVGKAMEYIGGGGNTQNAAARLDALSPSSLEDVVSIALDKGVNVEGELQPPKDSTIISAPGPYTKTKT